MVRSSRGSVDAGGDYSMHVRSTGWDAWWLFSLVGCLFREMVWTQEGEEALYLKPDREGTQCFMKEGWTRWEWDAGG